MKHEQNIDCGGGYVKLFDCSLDQTDMHGESPYEIMFGPDICGPGTKKVHVILSYKGKNHLINKDIRCKDDVYTHFYTLIVKPDNTYEVLIDNEKVESGNLEDDWDFLAPKKIKDPNASKPENWDDKVRVDKINFSFTLSAINSRMNRLLVKSTFTHSYIIYVIHIYIFRVKA